MGALRLMETLGQKRDRFTFELALWIVAVNQIPGYKLRLCEVLRSDEQAEINAMGAQGRAAFATFIMSRYPHLAAKIKNNTGSGIRTSVHTEGVGADAQLFVHGVWITDSKSQHWARVGEMWEQRGSDHRWGGRWGDGNHVSFEHEGRK